jgi:hypothetical protein
MNTTATSAGFTDAERAAMKARAEELRSSDLVRHARLR